MFYLDLLQGTQSKAKVLKAVSYIGSSKLKFNDFIEEFTISKDRDAQKLAWIIGKIVDTQSQLIALHVPTLLNKLQYPCHAAVKRNILRALDKIKLEADDLGLAADISFRLLNNTSETVAVRVFAMSILSKICIEEPELAMELITMLEYHVPHESAGFRSRANKIIKILSN